MTVAEKRSEKIEKMVAGAMANHGMEEQAARSWAEKQPVVVNVNMIAPDGVTMDIDIINGVATIRIVGTPSSRTYKWADIESKILEHGKNIRIK